MLKLKRFFAVAAAMAMTASCLPSVMAADTAENELTPQVMFYRDYEDYKGGNHQWTSDDVSGFSGNNGNLHGTWKWNIDGVAAPSEAIKGFDGTAVRYKFTGVNAHVTNKGTFGEISDGTLYFAFDAWADTTEPERCMYLRFDGAENSGDNGIFALTWLPGVKWTKSNVDYVTGDTSTEFMNGAASKTRVELIVDPEAGTIEKYFNGSFAQLQSFTPQTLKTAMFYLSQGHTMDNVAVVYYPEGYTGSFSVKNAQVNPAENTISVYLNSDACDPDGKYNHTSEVFDTAIVAPYGVTLDSVDSNSFAVAKGETALTVTGVTKGEKNGEYIIAVEEALGAGEFTVTVADGLTAIDGTAINTAAKEITFEAAEPQVLLYRDFEEYTGGNGFTNSGQYGTFKMSFDNDWGWRNASAENGRTGKGFRSNSTNQTLYHRAMPDDVRKADKGELYISFTSEAIEGAERSGRTSFGDSDGFAYFTSQHGVGYSLSGYADSKSMAKALPDDLLGLDYYKTELVLNMETDMLSVYINGTLVSYAAVNPSTDLANRYFQMYFEDGVIIDNLVILYYPENVLTQTFSMNVEKLDTANKQLTVVMTSDALDSDGANGSEIKAPYQIIPAEELTAADFVIDGLTVTGVEKGNTFGKYIITVAEELQAEVSYKVSLNKSFKDTLGNVYSGKAAEGCIITEPQILLYRDFEEYTGGNGFTNSGQYGTFKMSFDNDWGWRNASAENGRTGKGFRSNSTNQTIWRRAMPDNVRKADKGELYISFTSEAIAGVERKGRTSFGDSDGFAYFISQHGVGYSLSGYADSKSMAKALPDDLLGLDYYKTELVLNMETDMLSVYINGTLVSYAAVNPNTDLANRYFQMYFEDGVIIDNLVMLYYPADIEEQTFSLYAGAVDEAQNSVSVFLMSDASDSDLGSGALSKAPYGITLEELANTAFTVDGYTVKEIKKGATGEYVIVLAEDVAAGAELTVTANDSLKDIMGASINTEAKTVTVGKAGFELSDVALSGGRAAVVYTNTTETAKGFVLAIASYNEDGSLFEVQFNNAAAGAGVVNKEAYTALKNGVEGKTIKTFVFGSLTGMKPIK